MTDAAPWANDPIIDDSSPALTSNGPAPWANDPIIDGPSPQTAALAEPPASLGSIGTQALSGLATGVPHMLEAAPMAVVPTEAGATEDNPQAAINFDQFMRTNYGAPDYTKFPNGYADNVRQSGYQKFLQAGGFTPGSTVHGQVSQQIQKGLTSAGLNPDNYVPAPQNAPERIARMAGEGAADAASIALSGGATLPAALAEAGTGAVSGVTGQSAAELAPDDYKPLAALAGGLAGPAAVTGAIRGVAAIPAVQEAHAALPETVLGVPTGSAGAAQRQAGAYIQKALMDTPQAAINDIDANATPTVPGTAPISKDVVNDPGLSTLSDVIQRANPEPFIQRFDQNNAAREAAITSVQPEGRPSAVADALSAQRADVGNIIQTQIERAQQQLADQYSAIGAGEDNPIVAQKLRDNMQSLNDGYEAQERQLWEGIDPGGKAQAVSAPIVAANDRVYGDITPEKAIGVTPAEQQISDVISNYGDTIPLRNLIDLRSRISTEMRNAQSWASPNNEAYGRLSQLRGSVEDAIDQSTSQQVASEQAQVAAGTLDPQDTMYARLVQQMEDWRANRNAITEAGANSAAGDGTGEVGGEAATAGPSGTASQEGSGLSGNAGVQDVSGGNASALDGAKPITPQLRVMSGNNLIDSEAAARLRSASNYTKNLKSIQNADPVKSILAREGGSSYPYKLNPSGVIAKAWQAGDKGTDAINSTLKFTGSSPDSIAALTNMAANSLQDSLKGKPLTSEALSAWKDKYGPALAALDKAAPGTAARFEDMNATLDHLGALADIRNASADAMEKGALGKLLHVNDDQDVRKVIDGILSGKTATSDMRSLVQTIGDNPEAIEGLRKSIVDSMLDKVRSTTETGPTGSHALKSDALNKFINRNEGALREVFGSDVINGWRAVAQQLSRSTRTVNVAGQSGTHQFREAASRFSQLSPSEQRPSLLQSVLGRMINHPFAAITGAALFLTGHGLLDAAGGALGAEVVSRMREAGIRNINDLIRQAMVDPPTLKALLMAAPKKPGIGSAVTLAKRLGRLALTSGALASQQP